MNLKRILTNTVRETKIWGKKNAPELMIGAGLICFGSAIVLAAVQTTKAEEILDSTKERVDAINTTSDKAKVGQAIYSQDDRKHDLFITYTKAVGGMVKLYSPTLILAGAGTFCILYAHGMMKKRYAMLMAAYTTLEQGYNIYRDRIIKEFGPEADYYARTGIRPGEFIKREVDPSTGEVKETHIPVQSLPDEPSMYARYFDDHSRQFKPDMMSNVQFLRGEEQWFNHVLNDKGYVFLNDVYKALDIPPESFGQVVGWVATPGAHEKHLSFGITQGVRQAHLEQGYGTPSILLDFNVDGPVWELLDNYEQARKVAVTPNALPGG